MGDNPYASPVRGTRKNDKNRCLEKELKPIQVDVEDGGPHNPVLYRIKGGQGIMRGNPHWIHPSQTDAAPIVSMLKDPDVVDGRKVVYFAYEDGKPYQDGHSLPYVLGKEYGSVVLFKVVKDLTLFAIDFPQSRAWLASIMAQRRRQDLVEVLHRNFTPTTFGKRESDSEGDKNVAEFICGLKGPDGLPLFDGYGSSRKFYKHFHTEIALCVRGGVVPATSACVALLNHETWLKHRANEWQEKRGKRPSPPSLPHGGEGDEEDDKSFSPPKRRRGGGGRFLNFDDDSSDSEGAGSSSPPHIRQPVF